LTRYDCGENFITSNIIQQISDRAEAGRPHLAALDDLLDELEARCQETEERLAASTAIAAR